jgi:hypothetical protein
MAVSWCRALRSCRLVLVLLIFTTGACGGDGARSASVSTPMEQPTVTSGATTAGTAPIPTSTATPTIVPVPTATSTPLPVASDCEPTDQDHFVYQPTRLDVLASCVRISGVVRNVQTDSSDADAVFNVALDRAYEKYLSPGSFAGQNGQLHLEIVCYNLSSAPAFIKEGCAGNPVAPCSVALPRAGQRIWAEGRLVLDAPHGSWAELHPVYRWGLESGVPLPTQAATPPQPSRPPLQVDALVTGAEIARYWGFENDCSMFGWDSRWQTETVSGGALSITGESPWKAYVSRGGDYTFGELNGFAFKMKVNSSADAEIEIHKGSPGTTTYRRFGVSIQRGSLATSIFDGPQRRAPQSLQGSSSVTSDRWYEVIVAIGRNGEFALSVVDLDSGSNSSTYHERFDSSWVGQRWYLRIGANQGAIMIDDYVEFSFESWK